MPINVTFTVPNFALLELKTTGTTSDIQFEMIAPTEAGDPSTFPDANTDHWLNYSFISQKGKTGLILKSLIMVKLSDNSSIPPGAIIQLSAGQPSESNGAMGIPLEGALTLTKVNQALISKIGSSYTGNGPEKGYELTYLFKIDESDPDSYGNLYHGDFGTSTIVYTIHDDF